MKLNRKIENLKLNRNNNKKMTTAHNKMTKSKSI